MTGRANRPFRSADHEIAGRNNFVIAMALLALADLHGVKGRLVHAGLKELGLPGVALATSVSDVQGIDQGLGVLYAPDTMNSVAAYAGGDFLVAGFEQLAVHARQVLLLLVYAKTRIEFLHEVGIAVALSAEIRNVFRGRLADKTLSLVHSACGSVLGWVSAVAARTREAPAEMNIVLGVSDWFQQLALHLGVALDAGIFLLAVT